MLIEYLNFYRYQLPSCYLSDWICIATAMSQIKFFSCSYLMILTGHTGGTGLYGTVVWTSFHVTSGTGNWITMSNIIYPMFMLTPRIFHQVSWYCKNNDCHTHTLKVYQINLFAASVNSNKMHCCVCATVRHLCFGCTSPACPLS